jgi:hypothetical protein
MDGQIFRTMVFTRVIGYKKEMPGSGRWKMITDMRQDCWICAGHVYSLVFWCPGSIAQSQVNPDLIHPEKIESSLNAHVEDNAAKVAELEASPDIPAKQDKDRPRIYGPFTDWLPKKMWKIDDFARLYKNYTEKYIVDIMRGEGAEILNDEGVLDKTVETFDRINPSLRVYFKQVALDYDKEFVI